MSSARSSDVVAERFQLLLRHLGDGAGRPGRGWQRRVADRTGLHAPNITNLLSGKQRAGRELAAKVADRVGLDPRFFSTTDPATPEDWLREMDRRQLPEDQRRMFEIQTLDELVAEAHQVAMLLAVDRHPRVLAEARRFAERVLDAHFLRLARAVVDGPSSAQLDRAKELVTALVGHTVESLPGLPEGPLPNPPEEMSPEEDLAETESIVAGERERIRADVSNDKPAPRRRKRT